MGIENSMYFALGFLAALLLALVVAPVVWRRAVRLTRARIEAATPITLNEFRAEKDQLRAEFALSTRRLEKTVDALRTRLTAQLTDLDKARTELAGLRAEHARHAEIGEEMQAREQALQVRIQELEKSETDLAQRLRMRERDYETLAKELDAAHRQSLDGAPAQARSGAESAPANAADVRAAANEVRQALARLDEERGTSGDEANAGLAGAEAQFASAETRLETLLDQTGAAFEGDEVAAGGLLADKLSLDDELDALHTNISEVEAGIAKDWQTDRFEPEAMRARLSAIASQVSKLVYAVEEDTSSQEESLLDRVRKYAGDDLEPETLSPANTDNGEGLGHRIAALREIQARP